MARIAVSREAPFQEIFREPQVALSVLPSERIMQPLNNAAQARVEYPMLLKPNSNQRQGLSAGKLGGKLLKTPLVIRL
jgi:hypothetical protein